MYFKEMYATQTHDPEIKNLFHLSPPGPFLGDFFINVYVLLLIRYELLPEDLVSHGVLFWFGKLASPNQQAEFRRAVY